MNSSRRRAAGRRRNKNEGTGSPIKGEPEFVMVGKLRRPHGLRGEIMMSISTDFPERIKKGSILYLEPKFEPVTITNIRSHNKGMLISVEGYADRNSVEGIRGKGLFVRVDDRPVLPEGEYYQHELIGLLVVTDDGNELGVITEIIETGANNVYIVRSPDGKDILLPAIDDVIIEIDLDKKRIMVHLIEGLIPDSSEGK